MFFNPFKLIRNSFNLVFNGFFNLTGRLGQTPFITVFVFFFILGFNLPPLLAMFGVPIPILTVIIQTYIIAVLTILFFAAIRRSHDVGFTAFVLSIILIPNYIGIILAIVFLFWKGENNPNRWGGVPSDAGLEEMIMGSQRPDEDEFPY